MWKDGNDGKIRKVSKQVSKSSLFTVSLYNSLKKSFKSYSSPKALFKWQINTWSVIFMGLNWSFRWKFSKKVHLNKEFFSTKQWTWLGAIVWESSFFCGLCWIQILKVTYMSNLSKVFSSLSNKFQSFQRLEILRRFRIFVLSYRANLKRR